jgi:NADH:ubiquinone oxidoreductase subunit D
LRKTFVILLLSSIAVLAAEFKFPNYAALFETAEKIKERRARSALLEQEAEQLKIENSTLKKRGEGITFDLRKATYDFQLSEPIILAYLGLTRNFDVYYAIENECATREIIIFLASKEKIQEVKIVNDVVTKLIKCEISTPDLCAGVYEKANSRGVVEALLIKGFSNGKAIVKKDDGETLLIEAKSWCSWLTYKENTKVYIIERSLDAVVINEDGESEQFWIEEHL